MRSKVAIVSFMVVLAYGCASTATAPAKPAEALQGVASWYGEEFAGRTTANGEIFDPTLLTAAHRTLPFGTVLDVTNPKTAQTVRVRVNDRGPYIGGRMIDLSYAAAQQIGLIEPGVGTVDIKIVRMGSGEREPPVPFEATIAEAPKTVTVLPPTDAPNVAFPLPSQAAPPQVAPPPPADAVVERVPDVVVDKVEVQTQRGDVLTRKQVTPDGRTFEEVPVGRGEAPTASSYDEQQRNRQRRAASATKQFVVQVGAFAIEANATALQERLTAIGHKAFIARDDLYRVRIGPFATRDQAVEAREALEEAGISAMILAE
jgi:rare lipoprotein A